MPGVEGVPLFIGGGEASHSAELMRTSNFFHFRGQEGWLTASAGSATEYATPGTGVTIMPGPFLVNSRFAGGALQSYIGRILTAVNVPTTNVPPGDPRSDLVVMNIEDPYPQDGTFWPFPGAVGSESRRDGPYIRLRVIDGVPTNTLSIDDLDVGRPERGWTCIVIARLDRPANTGTVTQSMIKNLRTIINPWAGIQLPQEILDRIGDLEDALSELGDPVDGIPGQRFAVPAARLISGQCYYPASQNTVSPSDTSWKTWPMEGQNAILVPPWATHVAFSCDVIGAQFMTSSGSSGVDANVYLGFRFVLGNAYSQTTYNELIEPNDVYYASTPDKRATRPPILVNLKFVGEFKIATADIGKAVQGSTQISRFPGSGGRLYNGKLVALPGVTAGSWVYEFKEKHA